MTAKEFFHITCDVCGTQTETRVENFDYPYKGSLYEIKNVELEVCPKCGNAYFPGALAVAVEDKLAKQTRAPRAA